MDVFYVYTYGTAAWLTLQALPLLLTPKLITALLAPDGHQTSNLEIYLTRSLSLSFLLLATITLFFTGTIPLSTSTFQPLTPSTTSSSSSTTSDPKTPYAAPIVRITTLYHVAAAIYCYARYTNIVSAIGPNTENTTGYVLGGVGYGLMASVGVWCIVFGMGPGHVSKRTGADKRTTGFPFKNAAAYDKKRDRKMG